MDLTPDQRSAAPVGRSAAASERLTLVSNYAVWRLHHSNAEWVRTGYLLTARTDKEAQAKVKRKFSGCGFSSMSIVAVPFGVDPNTSTAAPGAPREARQPNDQTGRPVHPKP